MKNFVFFIFLFSLSLFSAPRKSVRPNILDEVERSGSKKKPLESIWVAKKRLASVWGFSKKKGQVFRFKSASWEGYSLWLHADKKSRVSRVVIAAPVKNLSALKEEVSFFTTRRDFLREGLFNKLIVHLGALNEVFALLGAPFENWEGNKSVVGVLNGAGNYKKVIYKLKQNTTEIPKEFKFKGVEKNLGPIKRLDVGWLDPAILLTATVTR